MLTKRIILFTLILLTTFSISYANEHNLYIGTEVIPTWNHFKKDLGKNNFQSYSTHFNIFGGWRFHKCFGLEVGHEFSLIAKKRKTFDTGAIVENLVIVIPNTQNEFFTKFKTNHTYAGLFAENPCLCDNVIFFGLAGFSISHVNGFSNLVSETDFSEELTAILNLVRNYKKTRVVPMIKAGVRYNINCNFGLRATFTWRNMSVFRTLRPEEDRNRAIKLKDSIGVGIGAYYAFC